MPVIKERKLRDLSLLQPNATVPEKQHFKQKSISDVLQPYNLQAVHRHFYIHVLLTTFKDWPHYL
jgi:hypothetical protein